MPVSFQICRRPLTRISCFVGDIVIQTLIDAATPCHPPFVRQFSLSSSFKLLLFPSKLKKKSRGNGGKGRRKAHGKYKLPKSGGRLHPVTLSPLSYDRHLTPRGKHGKKGDRKKTPDDAKRHHSACPLKYDTNAHYYIPRPTSFFPPYLVPSPLHTYPLSRSHYSLEQNISARKNLSLKHFPSWSTRPFPSTATTSLTALSLISPLPAMARIGTLYVNAFFAFQPQMFVLHL